MVENVTQSREIENQSKIKPKRNERDRNREIFNVQINRMQSNAKQTTFSKSDKTRMQHTKVFPFQRWPVYL